VHVDLRRPEADTLCVAGLQVLLIDAQADTRELLAGTLRHYGAHVAAAGSAGEAVELLQTLRPHVLVSNGELEEADAVILMRCLRRIEAESRRRVPTVAISAYRGAQHVLGQLSRGFQITLPAPVGGHELATLLRTLAAGGHPR